ncbi:MAG: ATP-binding protein [Sumerlaeia bacterium]
MILPSSLNFSLESLWLTGAGMLTLSEQGDAVMLLLAGFGFGILLAAIALYVATKRAFVPSSKFHLLMEGLPDALFFRLSEDLKITDVNTLAVAKLGHGPKELLNKSFLDLVPSNPWRLLDLKRNSSIGTTSRMDMTIQSREGAPVALSMTFLRMGSEWLVLGVDTRERSTRERALVRHRKRAEQLHAVVEAMEKGALVIEETGRVRYATPFASTLLGMEGGALVGGRFDEVLQRLGGAEDWRRLRLAVAEGIRWDELYSLKTTGEESLPIRLSYSGRRVGKSRKSFPAVVFLQAHDAPAGPAGSGFRSRWPAFEQAPIGVLVVDSVGCVTDANALIRQRIGPLFGWKTGEASPNLLQMAFLEDAGLLPHLKKVLKGQVVELPRARFRTGDELHAAFSIKAIPERGDEGEVLGAVIFVDDITERVKLQQRIANRARDLAGEKDRAIESNRLKSQFIATISHELRTPLNAILGFSRILAKKAAGRLDERQIRNIELIQSSGENLLALINDLLDLSKIEAGRIEINYEPISLDEPKPRFLQECTDHIAPMLEKNDNRLEFDIQPGLGQIQADPIRLQQILINLLGNAAKFTQHGVITLSARRATLGTRTSAVSISVSDTGIGIPPDRLRDVFDEFFQVDASTTREFGGTGLGLAISRKLARLMSGDIAVESSVGAGSRFIVTLPRKPRPTEPPPAQEPILTADPTRSGDGDDDAILAAALEEEFAAMADEWT